MDLYAELHHFLEKIRDSNILVVVEGKKDTAALAAFGVANVMELNKKPLYHVVEDISREHKECVLLVDLDKEGKKIFGTLNSNLQRHGVRVDNRFREFLFRKTKLRQIEGLATYLKSLEY